MTTLPAGWNPDPSVPGLLRWWDGTQWTAHTHPVVAGPASLTGDSTQLGSQPGIHTYTGAGGEPWQVAPGPPKRSPATVLLFVVLGAVLLIGGCAAGLGYLGYLGSREMRSKFDAANGYLEALANNDPDRAQTLTCPGSTAATQTLDTLTSVTWGGSYSLTGVEWIAGGDDTVTGTVGELVPVPVSVILGPDNCVAAVDVAASDGP